MNPILDGVLLDKAVTCISIISTLLCVSEAQGNKLLQAVILL